MPKKKNAGFFFLAGSWGSDGAEAEEAWAEAAREAAVELTTAECRRVKGAKAHAAALTTKDGR